MGTLINPASGVTHHHTYANADVFQWSNTNPYVPSGTNWRLKIGNGPFGYNYYDGTQYPVPFNQLSVSSVNLKLMNGQKCYATVEWSTDGGSTWSNGGTYTYFYCKP
ncbi:MAG: hypothetical protein WCH20_06440 [Nitrospira sp.]